MRETRRSLRHGLPLLLALARPGLALAAQPQPSPAKQGAAKLPAAKHIVDKRKGSKSKPPTDDKARQPYEAMVDAVSESVDEFREGNVSDNQGRDHLPEP